MCMRLFAPSDNHNSFSSGGANQRGEDRNDEEQSAHVVHRSFRLAEVPPKGGSHQTIRNYGNRTITSSALCSAGAKSAIATNRTMPAVVTETTIGRAASVRSSGGSSKRWTRDAIG